MCNLNLNTKKRNQQIQIVIHATNNWPGFFKNFNGIKEKIALATDQRPKRHACEMQRVILDWILE